MNGNKAAVRTLLQKKADVNAPQIDGTTALHWAVQADDLETADLLIRAGANVSAANRAGATPLLLAAVNGNAAMIEKLIKAGADPNAPLTKSGDTALMMAARTGKIDAVKVLLDRGAKVNAKETWGDTTALMWAVSERHPDVVKLLIERGADVNARRTLYRPPSGRGFEGTTPVAAKPGQAAEEYRQRLADAVDVCGARKRSGIGAPLGGGRRGCQCQSAATGKMRWAWRSSTAVTSCVVS